MKVKAVYRSKVNNRSIIILDEVFVNNKPRVIDVDEKRLNTLKGIAKQDWFDILEVYGEEAPAKVAAPAKTEAPAVKPEPVVEPAPAPVEETVVNEAPAEEASVEENIEETPVEETVVEEAPVEEAETEKKSSKGRKTKKTEE